ncbi:uncharacterized protein DUF4142 [Flavobacterium cutihirudinis]|uniref:Uncharacterized protein DUF4142 n=1 Tax=Flavobacterium cutihirudinis TaxID=1265740 RepID=A0A3D9FZN8_9FLAO|nr:DUF4142 domain-containing protein [Flavobacterium cutihirudinis]RED26333.1 uncharacterized protein DUF4142 [Flavobacterium cutihirudinis]
MKTKSFVKATIIKVFSSFIIVAFFSSCGKKEHKNESAFKTETLTRNKQQNDKEQIEASFFIATANVSNTIISKSQIAQKRSENLLELSKKIENQQNQLLQNVSEMANKKLIMITDINAIHKRDLYELVDSNDSVFSKTYLNSIAESLSEQIKLLEKISTETNDEKILKLVLEFLPEQYELLRETEKTKTEY